MEPNNVMKSNVYRSMSGVARHRYLFPAVLAVIAVFRIHQCVQLPVNTADVVRHICWGVIVNEHGYGAIDKSLMHFSVNLEHVSWSRLPYNYPILSLLFDQTCALLDPSIFEMKLMLTIIEFINALLVLKITRSRSLAILYWASPISIWWASHEGQFEPLQNLFVLLSLLVYRREDRRSLAYLLLGLGVQVKVTAIFLLPYYLLKEQNVPQTVRRCGFFLLAFLPTLPTLLIANPIELMRHSAALRYNPYFFNVFDRDIFLWNPLWLIVINQLVTYGLLAALVGYGVWKKSRERWIELLPLILYLLFVKFATNAQFWYMIPVLPFALTISDTRLRNFIFKASPLLDVRSSIQLVYGPFGWTTRWAHGNFSHGAFTDIRDLF